MSQPINTPLPGPSDAFDLRGDGAWRRSRELLNKVPEIARSVWIVRNRCTSIGEPPAWFLNDTSGLGLIGTSLVVGVLLIVTLVVQFLARVYIPRIYWLAVVVITVVGTLMSESRSIRGRSRLIRSVKSVAT